MEKIEEEIKQLKDDQETIVAMNTELSKTNLSLRAELDAVRTRVIELEAWTGKLRKAFESYGNHRSLCGIYEDYHPVKRLLGKQCDCGFDRALR